VASWLAANSGAEQTVTITDAMDDPNAEADLATYHRRFALPARATAKDCLCRVDEHDGTNYPRPDHDWACEMSPDLDMVCAVAPQASTKRPKGI
jgi:hypothetical protein